MAKWTPKHEAPAPLEGPIVPTIIGGTILWLVLFVVQLPFYGWHEDHGHTWWIWTCLAGGGLGFIGIYYVRRRDAAIKRDAARTAEEETAGPGTTAPGAAGPETAGPETAGPETAGPETAESTKTGPEAARSRAAESEDDDVTARPTTG
ncbi:DUF2530 domain-containing protein [Streptomyces scabiei]|uniref:DUF2530 domain-containing protein n=1 Tax=Streptomyces scabiei TaxID=1930 RepID=UPI0004E77BD8|nr:DUF2530 domain-containing protein [Streptomyces scabiei]KFG10682.1 hypothetical protein IQ61_01190 [Streptomyces scabiei]MDX2833595.1 DUF2530 domain-containing protein [Streptomyces scabiei]MDX3034985.1 DUF2530 domain-containing protein [Streptomyces scabiei]MDX3165088.1 DUF2530 domain-containing protein [Streptomyces scabiei]MDX3213482.1 DUF2530 domain-containing protein [Streptomyces scabiei]